MATIHVHGKLPDPFLKADGTRMTPEEWWANRDAIRDRVVTTEYGGMPPRPEVVTVEALNDGALQMCYRVHAGSRERQISFILSVARSGDQSLEGNKKYPVLLTGDGCYNNCESDTITEANRRGYVVARFNRLEMAYDRKTPREGGVYDLYPDHMGFTAISAWAWGYIAAMDALSQLPYIDMNEIGITGHSRGGKTVLLTSVMDERVKYVCPNNSGTHGCAVYRYELTDTEHSPHRTETLADMFKNFPHWMSEGLRPYENDIDKLPYDMHFFGALIAPRYYLQCEGLDDDWINPWGSRQTYLAVKACHAYLGCTDTVGAWFRPGGHRHKAPDFEQFLDFMDNARAGKAPLPAHRTDPYPEMETIFEL